MRAPPFASFYFDCDSTLSLIEGVEHITAHLGPDKVAELKALTKAAMDGDLPLERIYEDRLGIIDPTQEMVAGIAQAYIAKPTPRVRETIAALKFLGKEVGIISGGLLPGVQPFGAWLGIPAANIHAVPIHFDADGRYTDIDRSSHLWQNLGKNRVIEELPASHRPLAFVGDGITDLETKDDADLFIGFGGVERRARVEAEAPVYLTENNFAAILPVGLSPDEQARLRLEPAFAALIPDPSGSLA